MEYKNLFILQTLTKQRRIMEITAKIIYICFQAQAQEQEQAETQIIDKLKIFNFEEIKILNRLIDKYLLQNNNTVIAEDTELNNMINETKKELQKKQNKKQRAKKAVYRQIY